MCVFLEVCLCVLGVWVCVCVLGGVGVCFGHNTPREGN